MKPMNCIHQLKFDVNFAATPADELALPVWIQENLLPVIDQLMQQVSEQTARGSAKVRRIKRIEKLEIDLGTVTQAESATELQRRLHSQLLNALTFELAEKNEASIQEQEAHAQNIQLRDFLRTGQLSWHLEQHGKHAHKHLLNQVLNQSLSHATGQSIGQPLKPLDRHTRLEESLSHITQDDMQLTRLVRQFDTPELFQIIKGYLQKWPNRDQELILDWISLELLSLSNLSATSIASAATRMNSKNQQQEKFWKHILTASQRQQSWQSLIMSWLTQRQQSLAHALSSYRQAIERDATLSNSTRAALNLVLDNLYQELNPTHPEYAQYEITIARDLAWPDAEVGALRELIIASRTGAHHLNVDYALPAPSRNNRLNTDFESHGSTAPEAIIHALKIADFETLSAQWQHLLLNQTELIRSLQRSTWQLWLRNFKSIQILEIACVLQTSCAWFISRHQQRILDLAPAERDHLLAQLLASKPDSLNVSDLLISPRLVSWFEIQSVSALPSERAEQQHNNIEAPKTSPNSDLHRLLKAWPALLQKPTALLSLFFRHKQEYLRSLPISHLLEVAQITYPDIFQVWQPDLDLISTIDQHPNHESDLRSVFQSLFSTSENSLSPHAFIAMLSAQLTKNASAGFMLQWIKTKPRTNNHEVPLHRLSENKLEQNLASATQATLNAAIESCLETNVNSLFTLRPALWKHWLTYAGGTQQLKLARQFQPQRSDFFAMLERLSQTEKSAALAATLPLLLATLPGKLELVQLISSLEPELQETVERELSEASELKEFLKDKAQFLATRTPDSSPHPSVETSNERIKHQKNSDSILAIFQRKNHGNLGKFLSNLMLQRGLALAQFWWDLQQDQRNQYLTQLGFDTKVDLLALLYPELAQGLHQSINLLKNTALPPGENSSINERLKRQSSEIGVQPSTTSHHHLREIVIAIDSMLVSDKHQVTSATEIVKKFADSIRTIQNDPHQVGLKKIVASQKPSGNAGVDPDLNADQHTNLIAEMNLSDKLDTIWSALSTSSAEDTELNSTQNGHLLNPLLHGFRGWQSGHVELSQLTLTIDELEQYLHWWILQQTHSNSESAPENYALMLNSIKKAAQECTHPEFFMQLVLEALRDEQALDLEMFKTQSETLSTSNANTKLNRSENTPINATEKDHFLSQFGELSYDKITIQQEFSLFFDLCSNVQAKAEFEQSHNIFIQQFFLALSDAQETPTLFIQLQRDPGLLAFLNTAQLHQLIIARLQSTNSGSQFAKMGAEMNFENAPHQLLSELERIAYYSDVSREFLLAVWHKLNEGVEFHLNKLPPPIQKTQTERLESIYETQNLVASISAPCSTKNEEKFQLNLKQVLTTIFETNCVTTSTGNEHNDINFQAEFIPWFQSIQPQLQNRAFAVWTIEWLDAHAQSTSRQVSNNGIYGIYNETKSNKIESKEENTLLAPANFALILCVMQQALPRHLYTNWQRTAIDVFSLDETFWEKLSQPPFPTSSELYQACSASLAYTASIDDRKRDHLQKEEKSSVQEELISQIDRNIVSSLPPQLREALPHKLAQAMLEGRLQSLDLIWDEIRHHHADLLGQAQSRYLKNVSLREKLILNTPSTRLLDLVAALSPSASLCLKGLWQAWDICRRHLNPRMDLAQCQKQSISAAFSYLLNHPNSVSRPVFFLENVLIQLMDTKIDPQFLPDLLRTCLKELNADQSSQSSQLFLAIYEITQKDMLLESFNNILDWQEPPLSDQLDPRNEASVLVSLIPILGRAQIQSLFVQEICLHAPELIQDLLARITDETNSENANEKNSESGSRKNPEIPTEIASCTKLAKINANDYTSILSTALRHSTEDAREKFWHEYGVRLQESAPTGELLQIQASALNRSLLTLFATDSGNKTQLDQKSASLISQIQATTRQNDLQSESERNGEDITFSQTFSFDRLCLLLQTRRDLSLPEQKYLTLSLSRLHAADKLVWSNFISVLKDAFSLDRYLQLTKLHDLDRLFGLLRPELAMHIKDIIKRIEIIFDVSLSLSATVFTPTTWHAIYRAEFIGAQAHLYQDFLIKLFSDLAYSSSHSLSPTLPNPDTCLQKFKTYKPEARSGHLNAGNNDAITDTNNQTNRAKIDAPKVDKKKTNSSDSSEFLDHESHVLNAGMVIVAPYIQRLFGILELVKNGSFISDDAAQRAVHLLQYVVTGETHTPEFQLTLNKLLCNIHGGIPIVAGIEITPHEQEVIEQMLKGVISHWSILGSTSIQGLRDTFLRRQGYLYFEEDSWKLKIPQGSFDVLLDRLPWSFAMLRFPWMQAPLHVTWR